MVLRDDSQSDTISKEKFGEHDNFIAVTTSTTFCSILGMNETHI